MDTITIILLGVGVVCCTIGVCLKIAVRNFKRRREVEHFGRARAQMEKRLTQQTNVFRSNGRGGVVGEKPSAGKSDWSASPSFIRHGEPRPRPTSSYGGRYDSRPRPEDYPLPYAGLTVDPVPGNPSVFESREYREPVEGGGGSSGGAGASASWDSGSSSSSDSGSSSSDSGSSSSGSSD